MLFSPMKNDNAVKIKIPAGISKRVKTYASDIETVCDYSNYSGRRYDSESVFLDLITHWAFSRHCVNLGLFHEWGYQQGTYIDFVVEAAESGVILPLCIIPTAAGFDYNEAEEGLRLSRYRLLSETMVRLYIAARYDGKYVHFYGGCDRIQLENGDIWNLRPTVYQVPIEQLNFSMVELNDMLRKADKKQEVLQGLFF